MGCYTRPSIPATTPTAQPSIALEDQTLTLLAPRLAGIPIQELGEPVAGWTTDRDRPWPPWIFYSPAFNADLLYAVNE